MNSSGAVSGTPGLRSAGGPQVLERVGPDPQRPRLAAGVTVVEPLAPEAPWIIQDGPDRYFRVSPDFASVANSLDGSTPLDELASQLGDPWTSDDVWRTWEQLVAKDLVGDREPRPTTTSAFKYVPPLTFQLTVLDPAKVLTPFTRLIRMVTGHRGFTLQILFALAGIISLVLRPSMVWSAATTPLSLTSYGAVALSFVVATAIHEFGHGAVLVNHGGRPSRMGVMLFYLAPAFFCDVSDGWRLPDRRQRVQIACSGITTQAVVGAVAAFASLLPVTAPIRHELVLFAAGTYLGGILNLIPFVKFDGYLALMSHLDIPNLREKAMGDARQFGAWVLFGARRDPELPQYRWAVAYGFACIGFPFVIVLQAVSLWSRALSQIGIVGLVGMIVGILGCALVVVRGWRRMITFAVQTGAPRLRIALVTGAAAAAVLAGSVLLQVPRTVQGGYFTGADGAVHFIMPAGAHDELARGDRIELYRSGVLGRQLVAEARVADPTSTAQVGPISAVAPVVTTMTTKYPDTVRLAVAAAPEAASGIAIWQGPQIPLWRFALDSYIKPLV
ncbi:hypothetical protein LWF15_27650 [Kineosporia rhizophila]|uniref:daptide biosynthesis intramembrane metalloprotease n=1 Tax=Kineosporia rhizophila TaxID=84633 RepID=UPI001E648387|nr:daptide biosynthesis intramembrane metalloprotease [Kineosporia rhizophila]MCE0539279.1 hypothetical protein [Kineosporia rhizophila]